MSNDKDNGVNSLADDTFFDDINDDDIVFENNEPELDTKNQGASIDVESKKDETSNEAEQIKEESEEATEFPDKAVENDVKANKGASKADGNSRSPWLKKGIIAAAVLAGLYGLGMVASPPEPLISKSASLNVKTQPIQSQSSTTSADVLADFDSIKSQLSIPPGKRSVMEESTANEFTNKVIPELSDVSESAAVAIVNQELLSRVDIIEAQLQRVVDAIGAQTNSNDLDAVVTKQAALESQIKSLQDQLTEFKKIESKISSKAKAITVVKKADAPEISPPKLTAIMRVEGRGVFVTESGTEITLYKGERLKGFGTVTHVDINGCIYGRYGKKYQAEEALCE